MPPFHLYFTLQRHPIPIRTQCHLIKCVAQQADLVIGVMLNHLFRLFRGIVSVT